MKQANDTRQSELRKIVLSAGTNNGPKGITGGLMFNRQYFGQILEGERARVSELFCRIASDPRHCSVVLVEAVEVASRQFDRWAMGLAEKNETAEKLNAKFGFAKGFDPTGLRADLFSEYILQMVTLEDQLISISVSKW